jgi:hypothetical protein
MCLKSAKSYVPIRALETKSKKCHITRHRNGNLEVGKLVSDIGTALFLCKFGSPCAEATDFPARIKNHGYINQLPWFTQLNTDEKPRLASN